MYSHAATTSSKANTRSILLLMGMAILVFVLQPSANIVPTFDNRFSNAPVALFFDRIE